MLQMKEQASQHYSLTDEKYAWYYIVDEVV